MSYHARITKAAKALDDARFLIIGGGAGLSAAAGIDLDGELFRERFGDFISAYHITDLYTGGFYPFQTPEEKWAFWSRHIFFTRYDIGGTALYQTLLTLVRDKQYYVISTNVDSQFVLAGFDEERVFEVQGDMGNFQCRIPCHRKLYDNQAAIREMAGNIHNCRIPSALVPKCPVCGGEMNYNLRIDDSFLQDENWYRHEKSYGDFLEKSSYKKTVFMELGVGYNTPGIIRYPFERMTSQNPQAILIRLNRDDFCGAPENKSRTILFREDMSRVFSDILLNRKP